MLVSFSNIHLEVYITNLLWITVDLGKILILFYCLFHRQHFENGLGEAMCDQVYTVDTQSCYKDIYELK